MIRCKIALAYEAGGGDALSVLTDEKYFQGKLEYIQFVRDAVKLPVLRKDFLIDPYQVYEARAAGADAILLIAECLQINELIDLQILATELNLTTLIEVHDMDNLIRVRDRVIGFPHRSYSLLGINNRDLRTFKTDLGTTLRMAELVEDRKVLVSESGINTADDIQKLAAAGIGAVLIREKPDARQRRRRGEDQVDVRSLRSGLLAKAKPTAAHGLAGWVAVTGAASAGPDVSVLLSMMTSASIHEPSICLNFQVLAHRRVALFLGHILCRCRVAGDFQIPSVRPCDIGAGFVPRDRALPSSALF